MGAYPLKNRIMNTGHAAHFQTSDRLPTERYVDYVDERAKGGVAIIVTRHTVPHYVGCERADESKKVVIVGHRLGREI